MTPKPRDPGAIIAALAEREDVLSAAAGAFVSCAQTLLMLGVPAAELERLLALASEAVGE